MDLQIGNASYRVTRKMDAMRQFAVLRKITPLLASGVGEIVPIITKLRRDGVTSMGDIPLERFGQIATPVARELAKMTEEDSRFVVGSCLDLVDRKANGEPHWARVWNSEAASAMFDDVNTDLMLMLRLLFHVLQEVYGGFFLASPSAFNGGAGQT